MKLKMKGRSKVRIHLSLQQVVYFSIVKSNYFGVVNNKEACEKGFASLWYIPFIYGFHYVFAQRRVSMTATQN